VRPLWHWDLPQDVRPGGIGDVDDARPNTEVAHVADVEHVAAPHDLHPIAAAIEVGMADELEATLLKGPGRRGHCRDCGRFDGSTGAS
jgi:hypothetical protein